MPTDDQDIPEPMTFDDGSDVEVVIPQDTQPSSGVWKDVHTDALDDLTEEEMAAGEFLGAAIDPDDDDDDGSKWGTIENPTMTPEDFDGG